MSGRIANLPGARLAPETLLAQVAERAAAGEFGGVYICTVGKDGEINSSWSSMSNATQALMALYAVSDVLDGFYPDPGT